MCAAAHQCILYVTRESLVVCELVLSSTHCDTMEDDTMEDDTMEDEGTLVTSFMHSGLATTFTR